MSITRRLAAALLFLGLGLSAVDAQTYPAKVIKVVVPFTPGSPVDAIARVVTQHLQNRIGQSVIVENRPGGGTTIGAKAVATAAADGHTLLLIGPNVAYMSMLYPHLDFDPAKSLVAVASLVTWSHVMVVAPAVPAKTVAELIAHARANPGQLTFGFGQGTTPHILGETFKQVVRVDIASIPYRGGEQARADLLGGRIHINIAPVLTLLPLIQEGKARPLAFTGPTRSPDLPHVPTMIESGLPQVGYNPDVWLGIFAPVGTASAVIDRLNSEINASLRSPEMRATLAKLAVEPLPKTPQEFETFVAAERRKWPPLVRAAGLKAD
jgi:tripartite-type tricarboxylate transporter receptor subunit TctC